MESMIQNDLEGLNKRLSQLSAAGKEQSIKLNTPTITLSIPSGPVKAEAVHGDSGPREAAQAGTAKPQVPLLNLPNAPTQNLGQKTIPKTNQKTLAKSKTETALHQGLQVIHGPPKPQLHHSKSETHVGHKEHHDGHHAKTKGHHDDLHAKAKPKAHVGGGMHSPDSPAGSDRGGVRSSMRPSNSPKSKIRPTMYGGGKKKNKLAVGGHSTRHHASERHSTIKNTFWKPQVPTPEDVLLKNLQQAKPLCCDPAFTSSVDRVSDEVLSIGKTLVQWQSEYPVQAAMKNALVKHTVRPHFTEILDGIFPERLAGRDWHVEVSDIKSRRMEVQKAERAWQRMQAQEEARSGKSFLQTPSFGDLIPFRTGNSSPRSQSRDLSIIPGDEASSPRPHSSPFIGGGEEDLGFPRGSAISQRDGSDVNQESPEAPWAEYQSFEGKRKQTVHGQGPFAQREGAGRGKEDYEIDLADEEESRKRDQAATRIQAEFRRRRANEHVRNLREQQDSLHRSRLAYRSSIWAKHPMIDSAVAFTLKPDGVVTRDKFGMLVDGDATSTINKRREENKRQFRFGDWHKNTDQDLPDVSHLYPDGLAPQKVSSAPNKDEVETAAVNRPFVGPLAASMSTPQAKGKKDNALSPEKSTESKPSRQSQFLQQSQSSPSLFTSLTSQSPSSSFGLTVLPANSKKKSSMKKTRESLLNESPANPFSFNHDALIAAPATGKVSFSEKFFSEKVDVLTAWANQQQVAQDTEDHNSNRPKMRTSDKDAIGPSAQDDRELLSKAKLLRKRRWALVVKKNKAPVFPQVKDGPGTVGSSLPSRTPSPTKKVLFTLEVLSARIMVPEHVAAELHFMIAVVGDEKLPLAQAKTKRERCSVAGKTWGPDDDNCYGVNFRTYVVQLEAVEHAMVAIHNVDVDLKREPALQLCATKEIMLAEAIPGMNKAPLYQRGAIVGEIVYSVT